MTNPASGDDAARVEQMPCLSCGAGINEPCDLRMAGHDRTVWLNGVPDLVAENARLRDKGVLAYQHGYDHGADKFRSALKVERQIVKAKDAEIADLCSLIRDWSAYERSMTDPHLQETHLFLKRARAVLDRAKVAK